MSNDAGPALDLDRLAVQLAEVDMSEIGVRFVRENRPVPTVVWNPSLESLPNPELRFLYGYWTDLKQGAAMPLATDVRPEDMAPALGYVMILDVGADRTTFRYRLYGSIIADFAGRDWTGTTTAEMRVQNTMVGPLFFDAIYRAALLRRAPVFTENSSPPALSTVIWARLVLPLRDQGGEIARFLVGNVPRFPRTPAKSASRPAPKSATKPRA